VVHRVFHRTEEARSEAHPAPETSLVDHPMHQTGRFRSL